MAKKIEIFNDYVNSGIDRFYTYLHETKDARIQKKLLKRMQKSKEKLCTTMVYQAFKKKDGTEFFKPIGSNVTTIMGTQNIVLNNHVGLSKISNVTYFEKEPGLNVETGVTYTSDTWKIYGFMLGIDGGSGKTSYPVLRHKKGYSGLNVVPAFKVVKVGEDKPEDNLKIYGLRHVDTANNDVYYYIKRSVPKLRQMTVTGHDLPSSPDTYSGTEDVISQVTYDLEITAEELFQWFGIQSGSIENTRFNSLMLVMGRPANITIGGKVIPTYRDIFVSNKLNLTDRELRLTNLKFKYVLYYK